MKITPRSKEVRALNPEEFEAMANAQDALILDVRHQNDFVQGHIPQSIFIGIDGGFAPWVGALIADVKQPLVLVIPKGREEETITRLSRVGFDQSWVILTEVLPGKLLEKNMTALAVRLLLLKKLLLKMKPLFLT